MIQSMGPFIPSESDRESEKDQRTSEGDQRKKNSNIKENLYFRVSLRLV